MALASANAFLQDLLSGKTSLPDTAVNGLSPEEKYNYIQSLGYDFSPEEMAQAVAARASKAEPLSDDDVANLAGGVTALEGGLLGGGIAAGAAITVGGSIAIAVACF
jgi:hypothetical protein